MIYREPNFAFDVVATYVNVGVWQAQTEEREMIGVVGENAEDRGRRHLVQHGTIVEAGGLGRRLDSGGLAISIAPLRQGFTFWSLEMSFA